MPAPRLVEFDLLPPQARKRFADATRRQGYPQPILADTRGGGAHPILWIALALFGLLIAVSTLTSRYGTIYGYAQSPAALFGYVLGFFMLLGGVVYAVVAVLRSRSLPFARGVYVFPTDLVDARTKTLRIIPLEECVDARPFSPTQLVLRFADGFWHAFPVFGPQAAHQALYAIGAARQAVQQAAERGDNNVRAGLDAFFDARMYDAWQSARPEEGLQTRPVPGWARFAWAVGIGGAVVLSIPTWLVRNLTSDNSAFAKARVSDTVSDYEGYLYGKGRHTDEVKTRFLPAAALRDAKQKKTVAAIKEYLDKYPHSLYDADAQQALKDAYAWELAQAKAKGTVTALREFLVAYPDCYLVGDARAAVHDVFQKTLADFQQKAANDDPAMMPFVTALLAYLEANDSPPIEVRFTRKNGESLAVADKLLLASQEDEPSVGGVATASGHFDAKHSAPRESAIVTSLQNGFVDVFPSDVLRLEQAPAKSTGKAALPTMDIAYEVGWSGTTYHGDKSSRDFVGIKIDFDVKMRVPNAPAAKRCPPTKPQPWEHPAPEAPGALCPLQFSLSVKPPEHFTVSYDELLPEFRTNAILGGPSDEQVYEVMAARAFDQLATKVMAVFFAHRPEHKAKPPPSNAAPSDDDSPDTDPTDTPDPSGTSL
jgi:hypothetical protein